MTDPTTDAPAADAPVADAPVADAPVADAPLADAAPTAPAVAGPARCDVLLATYNGARYLPKQLDSLLAQSVADFRLLVRDDGSTDETRAVLERYAPRFEGRMVMVEDGPPTGSARGNFSILIARSTAPRVLFCDQDDVWFPEHVERLLALIDAAEARLGPDRPIYAATDLVPVDATLAPLADSYWAYKKTDPSLVPQLSRTLLTGGDFLGCGAGMNRALADICHPVPPDATNHDWWAIQLAIVFGELVWSPERLTWYRIHGENLSRPTKVDAGVYLRKRGKIARVRRGLLKKVAQARALEARFGDRMPPEARRLVRAFVSLPERGFFGRRLALLRHRFLYPDLLRNAALLIAV